MNDQQEVRPRARSAFAAAFLSVLFPGLGHAYARAWYRAIAFAAAPLLLIALAAGSLLSYRQEVLGFVLQPTVLVGILIGNVVAYLYRIVAAVDAYRVVAYLNRVQDGGPRLGPARSRLAPLSLAGLLAVILVMGGVHATVAFYDTQALSFINCVFGGSCDAPTDSPAPSGLATDAGPTDTPAPTLAPLPSVSIDPNATTLPSMVPWDGTGRLNVLLIGVDQRPHEGTFNTDTLIVASIDPVSRQVAMFSLPRDSTGIPLPPIPARSVFGMTWNQKINALYTQAQARPDLFPGGGFAALKSTLGYLYGIPINYYVEVNFDGFKKVVDALGGVTINVQVPVVDDNYPGDAGALRVYIPTGVQHMTGAEALIYARSRHGSSDFDRGARQQRVLLSLRQQADIGTLARPDVLAGLLNATKSAVKTDFPIAKLSQLIELASRIDISNIRSFVFAPPLYSTDQWPVSSNIIINAARIKQAVKTAFKFDPTAEAARQDIAQEGAQVWVLNGTGKLGSATDIAGYLDFQGVAASAPNTRPTGAVPKNTLIRVYNGAEAKLGKTIALLQDAFGVKVSLVTDPTVRVDIIITTGTATPALVAPIIP